MEKRTFKIEINDTITINNKHMELIYNKPGPFSNEEWENASLILCATKKAKNGKNNISIKEK